MSKFQFTSLEQALLATINAGKTLDDALAIVLDGETLDEELKEGTLSAIGAVRAAEAYLLAHAPRCPGCNTAYAFQRQPKAPSRCSWCGYDHDTKEGAQLVPASTPIPTQPVAEFIEQASLKRCIDILAVCKQAKSTEVRLDVRDFENLVNLAKPPVTHTEMAEMIRDWLNKEPATEWGEMEKLLDKAIEGEA